MPTEFRYPAADTLRPIPLVYVLELCETRNWDAGIETGCNRPIRPAVGKLALFHNAERQAAAIQSDRTVETRRTGKARNARTADTLRARRDRPRANPIA